MSTYEKCQPTDLLDYDGTTGALYQGALPAYAQAPYSGQLFTPVLESHPVSDDESIHYVGNRGYAGSPFDFPRSPSLEASTRPPPEVVSFDPANGAEGTKLTVQIQSTLDIINPVPWSFTLIFGSSRCECSVALVGVQKVLFQYALTVDVPPFSSTESTSSSIPVHYEQSVQAVSPGSRKRKMSCGSDDISSSNSAPVKQLRTKDSPRSSVYAESSLSASPYSAYLPTPASMTGYPANGQRVPSPLPPTQLDVYANVSQSRIKAPSPLASSWSPAFPDSTIADFNPRYNMTPLSQTTELPLSVRTGQNPTLIRTSTIQQSLAGSGAVSQNQSFNPYAIICISCIYWAGKKECYVTSVDTIYLLESLVGVRFTVEEKNRIRRNLEGFRPLTVSKAKAESEEFFKVIMGFPNPKPRNIEKDVKVFPWRILAHALKKIIGKYSASYSSTAGTLQAPLASNYPVNVNVNGQLDYPAGSSQRIVDVSSALGVPPQFRAQVYGNNQMAVASPMRAVGPSIDNQHAAYQFHRAQQQQVSSPALIPRHGSFDFNNFVTSSPSSTHPAPQDLPYSYSGNFTTVGRDANHSSYPPSHPGGGV
uniref:Medusa n=1 Tax=Coccidioides posadasii RMSCC 3488 TaxID=454284 RepID=A0A0J6IFN8_COCPO|nr:medusa [Coccidioides posadasii RMSCC 3488]